MKLAIYGAGGLGREVLELARQIQLAKPRWEDILFIDDIEPDRELKGVPVLTFSAAIKQNIEVAIAVGEPDVRARLAERVISAGIALATLIHPAIKLSECASVGAGSILCQNAYVSCDTILGINVFMQPYSSIGHDCRLDDHCVISPLVTMGGNCHIGQRVFVGMGATIRERVSVGENSIVSMSAAVFNDLPADCIAVGNPARIVRKNENKRVFK